MHVADRVTELLKARRDAQEVQQWMFSLAPLGVAFVFFFIFLLPMEIANKDIILVTGLAAGFAGLESIRAGLSLSDTVSMGGEILATALLFRFQKERGVDPAQLAEMRRALEEGLAYLLAAQREDGGWGFWWESESSPCSFRPATG